MSPLPAPLPCIMGPTGAGKTAAALALAEAMAALFPGGISVINADSRQVYKDFPVITAQPTPGERNRLPHLLYGFLECSRRLGAGEYARIARATIDEEREKNRLPVAVGGTGLYFKTLVEGMAPIPPVPEEISRHWQERCRSEGSPALHELLRQIDPGYAAKIHPNDRQRVTRALEVHAATGKPFSWWHARPHGKQAYAPIKVGLALPLSDLEPLLKKRIDLMLEAGALAEARAAFARCPDQDAPGWSGIGCAELLLHLKGDISLDACRTLWLKNTRAYAKRQLTWFRADREITWFAPQESGAVAAHVVNALRGMGW